MSVLDVIAAQAATVASALDDRGRVRRATIESKTLKRVSVSQVKTFRACEVKWAFDKVERIPRGPPSKGQAVGSEGHNQTEHFLKFGDDVRGPIARAGAEMLEPYLPWAPFNVAKRSGFKLRGLFGLSPEKAAAAEAEYFRYLESIGAGNVESALEGPTLFTPKGVEFVGFVDFAVRIAHDYAVVVDHKFKKSIDKYATTVEELSTDEQAILYPFWALQHWKGVRVVRFEHHQYQTQGRLHGSPVGINQTKDEIDDKFAALCNDIDTKLAPLAALDRARDATPNTASCGKYGGCEYAKICPYSPHNRWAAQFTTKPPGAETPNKGSIMGLLQSLGSGGKATAPSTVVASATPPGTLRLIKAGDCTPEKEYIMPGGPVGIFKALAGGQAFFLAKADNVPRMLPADTEVRDLEPTPAPVVEVAPPPPVVEVANNTILSSDAPASNPNVSTQAAAPAPAAEPVPADPKPEGKKRGRPTKEEAAAKAAAEGTPVPSSGFMLLIDCATNQQTTDLNAVVGAWAKKLALETDLLDVRLAPKKNKEGEDHVLAFGGWKGMLAGIARDNVPAGVCSINSSELNDPVIEALAGVASLVVRGGVK